jgi:hypothetical protein
VVTLIEQVTIDFEDMVQTIDCTAFRNCDHWSKSDGMNGQNGLFILPSVWISSDPEVDQVPILLSIKKSA